MSNINLSEIKNVKIVPKNYVSSTICTIQEIRENELEISLQKISDTELLEYSNGAEVELFGLNRHGIVYFMTEILNRKDNVILVKYPENIREIQRRKYSRVPFYGKLVLPNKKDVKIETDDISAGGLKFTSDTPFMVGDEYNIKVELVNNLVVECTMQPIRVEENDSESGLAYSISAKFKKIRSIDRIALMQYSLRLISELENKS